MNTEKVITNPHATHHTPNDGNSYITVNLLSTQETSVEKKPQDKDSTQLQELSLMNNTYFGAIHYDIHLDMKLDYTICRIFKKCHYKN